MHITLANFSRPWLKLQGFVYCLKNSHSHERMLCFAPCLILHLSLQHNTPTSSSLLCPSRMTHPCVTLQRLSVLHTFTSRAPPSPSTPHRHPPPVLLSRLLATDELSLALTCWFALDIFTIYQQDYPDVFEEDTPFDLELEDLG